MQVLAKMHSVAANWGDIIQHMQSNLSRKSVWSNIKRILLGAVAYYIWHERNLRLFKKGRRSVDQVFKIIYEVVRMKIMSFNLTNTSQSREAVDIWSIGKNESNTT